MIGIHIAGQQQIVSGSLLALAIPRHLYISPLIADQRSTLTSYQNFCLDFLEWTSGHSKKGKSLHRTCAELLLGPMHMVILQICVVRIRDMHPLNSMGPYCISRSLRCYGEPHRVFLTDFVKNPLKKKNSKVVACSIICSIIGVRSPRESITTPYMLCAHDTAMCMNPYPRLVYTTHN